VSRFSNFFKVTSLDSATFSLAKLGVGFGALAMDSVGLLTPLPIHKPAVSNSQTPQRAARFPRAKVHHPNRDDDEVVLILTLMSELI
jgi:hypothetical protein